MQKLKDMREYKQNKAVPNDRWQEILASVSAPKSTASICTYDRDNNLAKVGTSGGLWLITRQVSLFDHIDRKKSEVVTFFRDDKHRVWVVSTDNRIQIHDATMNPLDFSPDGRIVKDDTVFPYPVHSIKQRSSWKYPDGCKRSGVTHTATLKTEGPIQKSGNSKPMQQIRNIPTSITLYEIHIDRQGTLWVGGQYDKLNIARPDSTGSYIFPMHHDRFE